MSRFAHNVMTLGIGNIIAQVLSIGAVPVLTRLYTPSDYGTFSTYASITMILASVAPLEYQSAILLPGNEPDAKALLRISILSALLFGAILVPAILMILGQFGLFEGSILQQTVWLIPFGVIVLGLKQVAINWALRHKRFGTMARSVVGESVTDRGLALGLGFAGFTSALPLIAGRIFGPLLSTVWMMRGLVPQACGKATSTRAMIRRYRDFPLYAAPATLLNSASRELPTLLLVLLFSPAVAGLYSLGVRVMNLPMMMVGDAIAKVYRQKAAQDIIEGRAIRSVTQDLFSYLLLIALPPTVFLMFFGPQIFDLVFGHQWSEGGSYVQVLMPAFLTVFLHRVISSLFDILERQRQRLGFDVALSTTRILGLLIVGSLSNSPLAALVGLLAATLAVNGVAFLYLFGLVGVGTAAVRDILLRQIITILPMVCGLVAIKALAPPIPLEQLCLAITILAAHMIFVTLRDPHLSTILYQFMIRAGGKRCRRN